MFAKPIHFRFQGFATTCERAKLRPVHRRKVGNPVAFLIGFNMGTALNTDLPEDGKLDRFGIDATAVAIGADK